MVENRYSFQSLSKGYELLEQFFFKNVRIINIDLVKL